MQADRADEERTLQGAVAQAMEQLGLNRESAWEAREEHLRNMRRVEARQLDENRQTVMDMQQQLEEGFARRLGEIEAARQAGQLSSQVARETREAIEVRGGRCAVLYSPWVCGCLHASSGRRSGQRARAQASLLGVPPGGARHRLVRSKEEQQEPV